MNNTAIRLQKTAAATIAQGAMHLGDLVSWNSGDVHIRRVDLHSLFARYFGIAVADKLVPTPKLAVALTTAAARCRRKAFIVREFPRPNGDADVSLGVYSENATRGESGSDIVCGARVRAAAGVIVALSPENGIGVEDCMAHAAYIRDAARELIEYVATPDLGMAVVSAVRNSFGAVSIKDTGGVYFVPAAWSAAWRMFSRDLALLAGAVEKTLTDGVTIWAEGSFRPITIEVPDTPESARSIATGAHDALTDEIAALQSDLARMVADGGSAKRTPIASRIEECETILDRARLYGGVLRDFVSDLDEKCADLRASFENQLADYDRGARPGAADRSMARFAKAG